VPPDPVSVSFVDAMASMGDDRLQLLRERLRAVGFDGAFAARLARPGERLDDALRTPIRIWHARRMSEPAAIAARVLLLHDAVPRTEAERIFGDVGPLLGCGMLEETAAGLTSRVHAGFAGDALVLGDPPGAGPDSVAPLGGGTLALLAAVSPARRVPAALDLGCGAGAVALLLSRTSDRVLATDVSARAIAFARLNVRLNAVDNVELRQGDLYEPSGHERFDLVACQPPFLARRPEAPLSAYVHGGRRGDELTLEVLRGAPDRLTTGGRAVVLADLPVVDGDPIEERVRAAVGSAPVELLALLSPAKNVDEYCTFHAAAEHASLAEDFARAVIEQRDHLDGLGVRGLALTVVAVQPARAAGFRSTLAVRHASDVAVAAPTLDRVLEAHRLAFGDDETLLGARLRAPVGSRVVRQAAANGATGASSIVHPPPGRPEWPAVFDEPTTALLERIARARTVHDAARSLAEERVFPLEEASALVMQAAREGLRRGALDVEERKAR